MADEVVVRHDVDDEPPSLALVRVVSALSGESPIDLDPLFERVDPDALDRLLDPPRGTFGGPVRVVLDLGEYTIAVTPREVVAVDRSAGLDDRHFGPPEHR